MNADPIRFSLLVLLLTLVGCGSSPEEKAVAFYRQGSVSMEQGDFDKAIESFSKAIGQKPDFPDAFNSRGGAWAGKGEFKRAIEDFDKAIQLNPQYAEAFGNRGNCWVEVSEFAKAIEDYNEAIRLKPGFEAALLFNRGLAQLKLEDYDKAINDLKRAYVKSVPRDSLIAEQASIAFAANGDFAQAIEWINKAMTNDDENKAVRQRMLKSYEEGKPFRDEARK